MGSPAVKSHKRASKSSSSASDKSGSAANGNGVNGDQYMTTSTVSENFVESKLLCWLRLFRFVSLLSRQE